MDLVDSLINTMGYVNSVFQTHVENLPLSMVKNQIQKASDERMKQLNEQIMMEDSKEKKQPQGQKKQSPTKKKHKDSGDILTMSDEKKPQNITVKKKETTQTAPIKALPKPETKNIEQKQQKKVMPRANEDFDIFGEIDNAQQKQAPVQKKAESKIQPKNPNNNFLDMDLFGGGEPTPPQAKNNNNSNNLLGKDELFGNNNITKSLFKNLQHVMVVNDQVFRVQISARIESTNNKLYLNLQLQNHAVITFNNLQIEANPNFFGFGVKTKGLMPIMIMPSKMDNITIELAKGINKNNQQLTQNDLNIGFRLAINGHQMQFQIQYPMTVLLEPLKVEVNEFKAGWMKGPKENEFLTEKANLLLTNDTKIIELF